MANKPRPEAAKTIGELQKGDRLLLKGHLFICKGPIRAPKRLGGVNLKFECRQLFTPRLWGEALEETEFFGRRCYRMVSAGAEDGIK